MQASGRDIEAFLEGGRYVALGISVVATDYTRMIVRALAERGHDIVPIRPGVAEIDGRRAYASVFDVPGEIDGALIFTQPTRTERVAFECIERGIWRFWLDPGGTKGVSEDALELCQQHGAEVLCGGRVPSEPWLRRLRRESPFAASLALRRA